MGWQVEFVGKEIFSGNTDEELKTEVGIYWLNLLINVVLANLAAESE